MQACKKSTPDRKQSSSLPYARDACAPAPSTALTLLAEPLEAIHRARADGTLACLAGDEFIERDAGDFVNIW